METETSNINDAVNAYGSASQGEEPLAGRPIEFVGRVTSLKPDSTSLSRRKRWRVTFEVIKPLSPAGPVRRDEHVSIFMHSPSHEFQKGEEEIMNHTFSVSLFEEFSSEYYGSFSIRRFDSDQ